MRNPNTPVNKLKTLLEERWYSPDYPGGEKRFQLVSFARDLGTYILLPIIAVFVSQSFGSTKEKARKPASRVKIARLESAKEGSQVIVFGSAGARHPGSVKRAPGTLVRVRLQNTVESYGNAPVFAQVIDSGLGSSFVGGTLIGDATGDTNFDRLIVTFRIARNPREQQSAYPVSARALSLNGTLGLEALKKEGFVARAAIRAGSQGAQSEGSGGGLDLKELLVRALSSGLAQEFGASAKVEQNRSQVLTLQAGTEFFAELTDYFPAAGR